MGTLSIEQHLFPLVALSLFFAPCSLDRKKEEEETITAPSRPPPLPSFPLQFYARWLQSDESYDPTCTFAHSIAPIHQYHSFFAEISRRSSALKTLPGPSYGFGGVWRSLINKTVHRDTTQWADAHGPVYRVRFLHYHVSFFFFVVEEEEKSERLLRRRAFEGRRRRRAGGGRKGDRARPHLILLVLPCITRDKVTDDIRLPSQPTPDRTVERERLQPRLDHSLA